MNSEYQSQARKLEELRRKAGTVQNGGPSVSSTSSTPLVRTVKDRNACGESGDSRNLRSRSDPLIYPGLYAPSGIDIISILVKIQSRPNPTIDIGRVDSSVALVMVDAEQRDLPLIYCSGTFETLTGYTSQEVIGQNCRFLQYPPGQTTHQDRQIMEINAISRKVLSEKIARGEEAQVRLYNYKKDGRLFANLLTVIPIMWGEDGQVERKYIVGFQAEEGR